jgi:hypothetical protein
MIFSPSFSCSSAILAASFSLSFYRYTHTNIYIYIYIYIHVYPQGIMKGREGRGNKKGKKAQRGDVGVGKKMMEVDGARTSQAT